jgi:N-methylhydantoinase B
MSTDPFTMQIIRNYLIATAKEMVETTVRTAYSPTFAEGRDFSCGIFDTDGRMVIQSFGVGVHLGSLEGALGAMRSRYHDFKKGDIIVTNDPYVGTHQPDVIVCRPILYEGRHVGFALILGHWTDIGGAAAGGCAGTNTHVVQDGLTIPVCKLYDQGILVEEIRDFILRNVRLAEDNWGDLQSQIAATHAAESRICSLMARYGADAVLQGMQETIEYTRERFLAGLKAIPNGVYKAVDYLEDDGLTDRRYEYVVTVEKHDNGFTVDFTGTSPQAPTPINGGIGATRAATYCALIALVDTTIPANAGIFEQVKIIAPLGTIVNARPPAPVLAATFELSKRVPETILKAFADVVPNLVGAGGYCSGNNIAARFTDPRTGEESLWYNFYEGGQGATTRNDGNSGLYFWADSTLNQPIEVWEHKYPVLVETYALIPDSGGAGKYRGGLGTIHEIRVLTDHHLSGVADRHRIAPWGFGGGRPGRVNRWSIRRGDRQEEMQSFFRLKSPSKFYDLHIQKDDVIIIETGGGGGFGSPKDRDRAAIERDLREGYISTDAEYEPGNAKIPLVKHQT